MGKVQTHQGYETRQRREGEGALLLLAFLLVAMVAVAALIAGTVRHGLLQTPPAVLAPNLSPGQPSPSPTPLPRPGPPPTG